MLLTSAQAQCLAWVQRGNAVAVNPVGTPGQRVHHAMAYDSDRGVTVFFGGEIGKTGSEKYFNDTWEYDGSQWRQITIVGDVPAARSMHAMAYDPVSKRVLMYGGFGGGKYGFDDTWEYQGNGFSGTWTHVAGNASDQGYVGTGIMWAPYFHEILRAGGIQIPYDPNGIFVTFNSIATAYSWTGDWTADRNPGPLLWAFGMVFDTYRNVGVVVGGYDGALGDSATTTPSDVWEFRYNIGWTNTAHNFPGRGFPAMAYDERRHRLVVVGGDNGLFGTGEQVLELDSLHPESGWRSIVPLPSGMGRSGAAMVYDRKRGVMVLMGGAGPGAPNSNDGGRYDDTWELVPGALPQLYTSGPTTAGPLCYNSSFSLPVYATLPLSGYQWSVDGSSITDQTNYLLNLPAGFVGPGNHTFTATVFDYCGNPVSTNFSYIFYHPPIIRGVIAGNSLGSDPGTFYQCPGGSVSFTPDMVVDDFSLPTTYQWYHSGIALDGETNLALSLTNLRHEDSGSYSVVASDSCGSADSAQVYPVYLQVGVTIDSHPLDVAAQVCHSASFSVRAHGFGTLHYQWRMDGVPLPLDEHFFGTDTSSLFISPVLYALERDYDVVITDNCGAGNAVTSHVAQLTVKPGPQWVLRTTNGPPARYGNAMAYDSARGVTVLYGGGQSVSNVGYVGFGEVWEWNGAHWIQRATYNSTSAWKQVTGGYWSPVYGDTPVGRLQHAMAYDSRRHRVVMFGGRGAGPIGGDYAFSDTWEWDGLRWYFRTTNGPPPQFDHHMAYDPNRGVTVLYGGFGAGAARVWEWNGTNWTFISPTNGPALLPYDQPVASMDYDSSLGQVFFGPAGNGFSLRFYWIWNGHDWLDGGTGFGIFDSSPPSGAMVFDTYRKRSILFGGQDNGFNAAYGGSTDATYNWRHGWSEMPNAVQISMLGPEDFLNSTGIAAKLSAHSDPVSQFLWTNFLSATQATLADPASTPDQLGSTLATALNGIITGNSIYDASRFVGVTLSTETIIFRAINPVGTDVARFNRLLLEDVFPAEIRRGFSIPTGRSRHAMAFDSARHAAVLMGGLYGFPNTVGNETWELLDLDMALINEQPASQYRAPGDTAVLNVAAVGPFGTSLSYQWFYGAMPLNNDSRISGAQSPTLRIANLTASDAGQYQVRISDDCGSIYSAPAVLTANPLLQIFSAANASTLVWSAPNMVLEEADSVGGPWTAIPGAVSPFDVTASGPAKFFRLVSSGP